MGCALRNVVGNITANRIPLVQLKTRAGWMKFLVDTGFNGYISLPPSVIKKLGLEVAGKAPYQLADGSIVEFEFYIAKLSDICGECGCEYGDEEIIVIAGDDRDKRAGAIGMRFIDGCIALFDLDENTVQITDKGG